jgi:CheY-like chemotaxis protein
MLFDHDVTIANDGQQALEVWAKTDFDLVVCDLMMPRISGMDVYQVIKAHGDGREKRMIFITGGAFTSATRSFVAKLDQPCLQKPFSPMDLRLLVRQAIAKSDD